MTLSEKITLLSKRIAQEINTLKNLISNKVNSTEQTPNGYLKTNEEGDVYIDLGVIPTAPDVDGISYVLKDGVWVKLTEVAVEEHTHDGRYYTETELDILLNNKENVFVKNTGFNKDFGTGEDNVAQGNHNHNSIYYTKPEINSLLSEGVSQNHNHDDRYYTKNQVETLIQNDLGDTHNHNDLYYTEQEVNDLLDTKANIIHNHDDRYYTEQEVDTFLNSYALESHNHDDRYYTEQEVDDIISNLDLSGSNSGTLTPTEGIAVVLPSGGSFGKYKTGDIIPGGLNAMEVIMQAVSEAQNAVFNTATAVLSGTPSPAAIWEKGESITVDLNINFTQNDSGIANSYIILRNGTQIHNNNSTSGTTGEAIILTTEGTEFTGVVSYNAGEGTKLNSLGQPEPNTIEAGSINTSVLTYRGYNPIFYGSVSQEATDNTSVRTLTKVLDNNTSSITLNTGTTNNIFQVWLPLGKSISQVTDLDALNANITSSYVSSTLDILDAGGNQLQGNLFTMSQDIPYGSNHRHSITIQ